MSENISKSLFVMCDAPCTTKNENGMRGTEGRQTKVVGEERVKGEDTPQNTTNLLPNELSRK